MASITNKEENSSHVRTARERTVVETEAQGNPIQKELMEKILGSTSERNC